MDLPTPEPYLAHSYFFAEIGNRDKAIQSPFVFSAGCVTKNISVLIIVRVKVECRKNHTFLEGMFSDVTYTRLRGNFNPTGTDHG